jgi:hypothetical protein
MRRIESGINSGGLLDEHAIIDYLICRATNNATIRGKGKISFPGPVLDRFRGGSKQVCASNFAKTIEDGWKMETDAAHLSGVTELSVAWREWWLGHWNYA